MKILSWNCRGLCHPRTVRTARSLARGNGINLLFIMKTKCTVNSLCSLVCRIGFQNYYGVDACGNSGGLWVAWDASVNVQVLETSNRFIFLRILDEVFGEWFLILIYGHPVQSRREEVWKELADLASKVSGPLLIMRDFNQVLDADEKWSKNTKQIRGMD